LKHIVTAEDVQSVAPGAELVAPVGAVVTSWAQEMADSRGVRIVLRNLPVAPAAVEKPVTIAIGADHGGYALKESLKPLLEARGHPVRDMGTFSTDAVDYPDIALAVARSVRSGECGLGILIDGAGIGSAMAANKVPGVRAALCVDPAAARNAREHNDANVLTLGAKFADPPAIVEAFLGSRLTEERHARRVEKIRAIEESYRR
jgi:ribose 5-phosphate isomerase B